MYREFGYYRNALCSFAFEGESGMHTMQELMKKLRANAPEDIAGYKVESVVDYDTDGTGLPRANVLEYHLDGGHMNFREKLMKGIIIRLSIIHFIMTILSYWEISIGLENSDGQIR